MDMVPLPLQQELMPVLTNENRNSRIASFFSFLLLHTMAARPTQDIYALPKGEEANSSRGGVGSGAVPSNFPNQCHPWRSPRRQRKRREVEVAAASCLCWCGGWWTRAGSTKCVTTSSLAFDIRRTSTGNSDGDSGVMFFCYDRSAMIGTACCQIVVHFPSKYFAIDVSLQETSLTIG